MLTDPQYSSHILFNFHVHLSVSFCTEKHNNNNKIIIIISWGALIPANSVCFVCFGCCIILFVNCIVLFVYCIVNHIVIFSLYKCPIE